MEADAPPLLETETKGFFLGSRGGGCGGGSGGGCKAEEKENLVATRAGGRDCFHGNWWLLLMLLLLWMTQHRAQHRGALHALIPLFFSVSCFCLSLSLWDSSPSAFFRALKSSPSTLSFEPWGTSWPQHGLKHACVFAVRVYVCVLCLCMRVWVCMYESKHEAEWIIAGHLLRGMGWPHGNIHRLVDRGGTFTEGLGVGDERASASSPMLHLLLGMDWYYGNIHNLDEGGGGGGGERRIGRGWWTSTDKFPNVASVVRHGLAPREHS